MNSTRAPLFEAYRNAIGYRLAELTTPALILDLPLLRENVAAMATKFRALPGKLRPHIKVHKSPTIARMQIDAGAIGVTCATVWEACAMLEAGIDNVLVANQVVGPGKIATLARAARDRTVLCALDDAGNAAALSAAVVEAGSRLGIFIEVDIGMGRSGVRTAAAAATLATAVARLPGLQLRGIQAYEGHCMHEPDRTVRAKKAATAMTIAIAAADAIRAAGIACDIISGGGTGTFDMSGTNPRITEIQAGSYTVMDGFHGGLVSGFAYALRVRTTVVSRQGDTVILDAGRKSIGIELTQPHVFGMDLKIRAVHEEHTLIDADPSCSLAVGDQVEIVPGYAPTTVNFYDVYHVVEEGRVVDIWPVMARGPGHSGFM